jgi:hypothetical protein
MGYTVETTKSVYDNDTGVCISVGPDTDGLGGLVRIYVPNSLSEKTFGKVDLTISFEMAEILAETILSTIKELPK